MADPKTGRVVSQDDWKRTQVRMPQDKYEEIAKYAESKNISLNTAMLFLMDKGLMLESPDIAIENISTEILMMELASRMKGYVLTVSEKQDVKKAP